MSQQRQRPSHEQMEKEILHNNKYFDTGNDIHKEVKFIPNPILEGTWACIKNQYMISPIYGGNGRVLVEEDPFKSRFDCSKCGGKKHLGVLCPRCKGTKISNSTPCWECQVPSEKTANNQGGMEPLGYVPCDQCKGQGGTIVIPDESKRNTTTGNVLAISNRDILEVKVGEKVMFTNYSGSPFQFLGSDLRIIIERDLLGKVKAMKKNVEGLNEGTFADLENTGVPRE